MDSPLFADLDLAPLHMRALAAAVDSAILIVLALTVGSFAVASGTGLGAVLPVMVAVSAAYHIGFVATTGATPGKMASGLQVVTAEGGQPRPDTAVLRFLVYFAFGVAFPIGTVANVASMLADERRRTFADRIARTVVLQARRD